MCVGGGGAGVESRYIKVVIVCLIENEKVIEETEKKKRLRDRQTDRKGEKTSRVE